MELWVRSQDKRLLCKVDSLNCYKLNGSFNISTGNQLLGKYSTEERCFEIIDEIQKRLLNFGFMFSGCCSKANFDMIYDNVSKSGCACVPYGAIIQQKTNNIIYQMPEN